MHSATSWNSSVSPPLRKLLSRVHQQWRKHRPVAASLWSQVELEAAEDLSDQGLEAWREELLSLRGELSAARRHPLSGWDDALAAELERFLNEQWLLNADHRVFETTARPYLDLVAMALLPLALGAVTSAAIREARVRACISWLREGERRLASGRLRTTPHDVGLANHLQGAVATCTALEPAPVWALLSHLNSWTKAPLPEGGPVPNRLDLLWYIQSVMGVKRDTGDLANMAMGRLNREVSALCGTVQDSGQCDSPAVGLALARQLESRLREVVAGRLLARDTSSVLMAEVPPIARSLVEDALFASAAMGGLSTGVSGWLLWRPDILACTLPDMAARLALVLAHEVCPGHAEQLARAAASPLALLYEITRSPLGLEGWACLAEEAVVEVRDAIPNAERILRFQRVRRLMAAAQVLVGRAAGEGEAAAAIEQSVSRVPVDLREALLSVRHSSRLAPLLYSLGLIEVEEALTSISTKTLTSSRDHRTVERLLRIGPMAPHQAAALAIEAVVDGPETGGGFSCEPSQ